MCIVAKPHEKEPAAGIDDPINPQLQIARRARYGIKLGQVLSMQISSSGWPYPLEANAGAAVGSGGQAIASPAPVPPSVICDRQSGCMAPSPVSVQTFVSVTVTWAIA